MSKIIPIQIFDTTLRDGQQCPGAGMSRDNNIIYAEMAANLGVDILEAGFPSASKLDFDIVFDIATMLPEKGFKTKIAALTQLRAELIDKTIEALIPATKHNLGRVHIYLPVDPKLMEASLGVKAKDKSFLIRELEKEVSKAVKAGLEVEFSPEGYSRMNENESFVLDAIKACVANGATIINCPDTIGGACWLQQDKHFAYKMKSQAEIIKKEFPDKNIIWSAHCHNDFGLALHNSMIAVFEGPARQIEGCFNGIGERAGNVALEQCIILLKEFGDTIFPDVTFTTNIKTEKLTAISNFVAKHMLPRQPHQPVVGDNAAKHSSGGHTNAILRDPLAYQPFDPEIVGKKVGFAFGPLSGSNHAKSVIEDAGFSCLDSEKMAVAQFIKNLYKDRRKGISDEEIIKGYFYYRAPIAIQYYDYAKKRNLAEVTISGKLFGKEGEFTHRLDGNDSGLAALSALLGTEYQGLSFNHYTSEAAGSGVSAVGISTVTVSDSEGSVYVGKGEDRDIEISAMKALVDAYNKAYISKEFAKKTHYVDKQHVIAGS